jgi:alpha-L-arabinofuranosidase
MTGRPNFCPFDLPSLSNGRKQSHNMNREIKRWMFACFICLLSSTQGHAQSYPVLNVNVARSQARIEPTMWGIFFEDINMAADGGIYAELVKNRSFEFSSPMMGWKELKSGRGAGAIVVENRSSINPANPRYAAVTMLTDSGYGLSNEGFRGMGIRAGSSYTFSIWARQHTGHTLITIELTDQEGRRIGAATVQPQGADWKKYEVRLAASATTQKARLNLWFSGKGRLDIDMISLFPVNTWKGRPGGLRPDLVQLLADLKPGFLRFPGGCIVEGRELTNRYQWKRTVGPVEERWQIVNRWNTEFRHRPTPDYYQSFGLGFFEYFQLAEDIGAEPLPILNCGMACQFNTAEVVPVEELGPYIQDALDLIEFANGPITSKWGKVRAQMGHPNPFHLKMMGVGNEQWGPQYIERFQVIARAIKAKYPAIRLVNSVGPDPEGERFTFLNNTLRKLKADLLDEHYYRAPEWFLKNAGRYDNYDRKGPKIFAGEYAAQSNGIANPVNRNNWQCALAEAAFMTGLERNADVVAMASYAPLFAHIDGWQWTPDLIWFDNLEAYGTPNYYVQKLFSNNKGSYVVPITQGGHPLEGEDSLYASASVDQATHEVVLKLVNVAHQKRSRRITITGVNALDRNATETILAGDQMDAVNSFAQPQAIGPRQQTIATEGNDLSLVMEPYSLTVVRIAVRK